MLKHRELTDPKSCLNKAAPDEPIFVLRAKDARAAMAVRHWATMAHGLHEPEKLQEAEALAQQMDDWRKRNVPEPLAVPDIALCGLASEAARAS